MFPVCLNIPPHLGRISQPWVSLFVTLPERLRALTHQAGQQVGGIRCLELTPSAIGELKG